MHLFLYNYSTLKKAKFDGKGAKLATLQLISCQCN